MTNKQSGVLRQPDEQELHALVDIATTEYVDSVQGIDEYFRTDANTGRAIAGERTGARVLVLATSAFDILPQYVDHFSRGYTLHPEGTQAGPGATFTISLWKPEADQKADLAKIHAQVEADYLASIAADNKVIIDRVVAQRVAAEEAKERAVAEKKRGTRYAALEQEVKLALGAKQ